MLTLVQVYGDNTTKKTALHKWVKRFSEGRESVTDEERSGRPASNKQNWRKHCKSSSNCAWKPSADSQEHGRASEHRQRNSKENLNWISWHEEGVCRNGPKWANRRTKARMSHNLPRPFGETRWHFGPCHHRWWSMSLAIRPWNEAAKCTMEDCQFPTTKKVPSVQIKSQNNVADLFWY